MTKEGTLLMSQRKKMSCTLNLVSSSIAKQKPTVSSDLIFQTAQHEQEPADLVFQLDMSELPKFSMTEIWGKKISNPLRDRIMIEWLFSYSAAEKQLNVMVTKINEEIERQIPAKKSMIETGTISLNQSEGDSITEKSPANALSSLNDPPDPSPGPTETPKILVIISCPDGQQYSPCFVEKLREICEKDKRLHIITEHRDLLLNMKKKFVWYHTKIPRLYVQHVEMLTNKKFWVPFDENMNSHLEQTFQEDPNCSIIHNDKDVVDFASGTLYNKQKRKTFCIRSTFLLVEERRNVVNCRFVGDEEYKATVRRYDAAGILFYSVHPATGEAVFLLGQLTYSSLTWCDFGGLKSFKKFREPARHTAARECYEETLGVMGNTQRLVGMLENYKTNNVFKVVNEMYNYVEHFLRIPFMDYQMKFEEAVRNNPHLEVDKIRWFPMTAMRHAVDLGLNNDRVIVSCLNKAHDKEPSCEFRIEFVHTLCIAEKLGILDSIDYITKQLHKSSLAPPPRPISYPKTPPEQQVNIDSDHKTSTKSATASCALSTHHSNDKQKNSALKLSEPELEFEHLHMSDNSSPVSIASFDAVSTEDADVVSRSRAWSFEEFVAGLVTPAVSGGEGRRSLLKPKKQAKAVKKERKNASTPIVNSRPVIFYGMGAGTFGI